jgi:nucleotidyltransferase/DNA polymerase involved in DNA repair
MTYTLYADKNSALLYFAKEYGIAQGLNLFNKKKKQGYLVQIGSFKTKREALAKKDRVMAFAAYQKGRLGRSLGGDFLYCRH